MSDQRPRGGYSVVRSDSSPAKAAEDAADARAFGNTVRLQYGPVKIGVPAVLIGAAASWLVSRYAVPATPIDCARSAEVTALTTKIDVQAVDIRNLTTLVNQYAEREQNHFALLQVTIANKK